MTTSHPHPRKQSKYITGTVQQRIIAPQKLLTRPPDTVIIMNPIYTTETQKILSNLGLQPEVPVA